MIASKRRIYKLPILVFVVGAACSAALFYQMIGWQQERIANDFARVAGDRSAAIAQRIQSDLLIPESLRQFFEASDFVEEREFSTYTVPILDRTQEVELLAWVQEIQDATGKKSWPIRYLESVEEVAGKNRMKLEDIPNLEPILGESFSEGKPHWVNMASSHEREGGHDEWWIILPATQEPPADATESAASNQTPVKRQGGMLLVQIDLHRLMHSALDGLQKIGMDAVISKETPVGQQALSYWFSATRKSPYDPVKEKSAANYAYSRSLLVGEEKWIIYCRPAPAFLARYDWREEALISMGALVISLLLAGYILRQRITEATLLGQNARIKLLQDVATTANYSGSNEQLLADSIQRICNYLDWPFGHVYLVDESSRKLVSSRIFSLADPLRFEPMRQETQVLDFTSGVGMPGRVLMTRKPVFISDVSEFEDFRRKKSAGKTGLHACFAFPIIVRENVAAVMEFFHTDVSTPFVGWEELVLSISTQISHALERRLSAEELRKKNSVLENAAEGIAHVNTEGVYLSVNKAYATMCASPASELIGKNGRTMVHAEDISIFQAAHEKMLVEGRAEVKGRRLRSDGTIYYQELTMVRDTDLSGKVRGCYLFSRDVTAREKQQAALRESEDRFMAFMDNNPAGASIKDENGRVLYINKTTTELFGLTESVIGKIPEELATPEAARLIRESDNRLLATNEPVSLVEDLPNKDGVMRHWLVYKFPMKSGEGKRLIGVLCFDNTDRQRAEEAIVQARDAAVESARLKSQFLANMSHEIRTPMNGLIGMLGLLARTSLDGRQNELLQLARQSSDSLLRLLNDILDFSKIEAGKLELEPGIFDPRQCVRHAVKLLAVSAVQKGLLLNHDVDEGVPAYLLGDAGRLAQVLVNLINNGIKFTKKGLVYVTTSVESRDGDDIVLHFAIRDTGVGVAQEKQTVIFDPFRQADNSTSRSFGGTGLGLAICSQLVALMGGRIWIESEKDEGSIFHFTARFQVSPPPRPLQLPEGTPAATGGAAKAATSLRILLAEDNPINQRLVMELLEHRGHRIEVAADGLEAVKLFQEKSFDLILMDIQMPRMDGYAATIQIRQLAGGDSIPIIAMTANALPEDRRRCLEVGMTAFLTKPLVIDKFVTVVENQYFEDVESPETKLPEPILLEEPPFKYEEALQRALGRESLLMQITQLFLQQSVVDAGQILQALEEGNAHILEKVAHRLRGAASSLSAGPLCATLQRLENFGRQLDLNAAKGERQFFEKELARLCDVLRNLQPIAQ